MDDDDDFLRELEALNDNAEGLAAQQDQWEYLDAIERCVKEASKIGLGSESVIRQSIDAAKNSEVFEEAMEQTRRRVTSVAESNSKKILGKRSGSVMEEIKGHVRKAREKERMRTVAYYLCDRCDKPILNPEDGFIVQGNIYVADASCRGGLIGSAFPSPSEDGSNLIDVNKINEIVFCKTCLLSALGMDSVKPTTGAALGPRR